ncbi:MAG: type II toxin-antitoxin system VapC family toxin [Candidatus Hadarchaeales archaeon]
MNLLDTDVIINLLREKRYEAGAISVLTLIELLRGLTAEKRTQTKKLLEESFTVLGIDNKIIEIYCSLYQEVKRRGMLLPDADLLIAATAMSHGLALKTANKQHFKRLEKLGLKLAGESSDHHEL